MARSKGGHLYCPTRANWRFLDHLTGEIFDAGSCGRIQCPYCIEVRIWRTAVVFNHSAPSRYAVLTGLKPTWQENRDILSKLFKRLDRAGYNLRAFYTIERNPKDTGFHLNLWWHGPDVPVRLLSEIAEDLGWGSYVHVQRWRARSGADSYGTKDASTYGTKDASADGVSEPNATLTDKQQDYLAINGARLFHARSSFYRDGVGGESLRNFAATYRAARGQRGRTSWTLYGASGPVRHSPIENSASATPQPQDGTPSDAPVKSLSPAWAGVQLALEVDSLWSWSALVTNTSAESRTTSPNMATAGRSSPT